ncbi:MAG: hypothetical protein ABI893_05940 [Polaromonas sp.]|uniref:hypothetical protein n=1 Tax=Polaromonas sp. TaxID=1869339 RepID=UPI003263E0DC
MTKDLAAFSSDLRGMVGDAAGIRPLLCSGNPFDCKVALVGANPGSATPFWPSWTDANGVDKEAWLQAYRQQHGGYGRSRAAIERFLPLVNAQVIELNAHAKQTARLGQLAVKDRTTEVLAYLLRAVRPRVALCAGASAVTAVTEMHVDWPMKIIEAPHFIYWGRERERRMAAEINAYL